MRDATPEARCASHRTRVERALERALPAPDGDPSDLHRAMAYTLLGGGKRMRALLVYATGEALSLKADALDHVACAVETIHVYSLIHDDLPAMDDDDLRRGRPSCHVAFGEATAILAGDALQALAFSILTDERHAPPAAVNLEQVRELARACGAPGMAGGQALDLDAVNRALDLPALETMHAKKTGALIRAAIRMPALQVTDLPASALAELDGFGHRVGLAFQVQDDILDASASTRTLGKTSGRDAACNKPTFPSLMGLEGARRHAQDLVEEALSLIDHRDRRADFLRYLARYAIDRAS